MKPHHTSGDPSANASAQAARLAQARHHRVAWSGQTDRQAAIGRGASNAKPAQIRNIHQEQAKLNTIAILPGDGIGPEVTAQARRVLEWFIAHRGLTVELREHPYGSGAYRAHGLFLPETTESAIRTADAVLLGAVGGTDADAIPRAARSAGSLPKVRRMLDLFANLRPITTHPALFEASSLKNRVLEGVDCVIVRELIGGIYFGEPRGIETLPDGQRRGYNTQTYTSEEIRRIARFAFELAAKRSYRVCSVDKANVMEAGQLWREEVQALRDAEYPEIDLRHLYADNCAMQLVRAPAQFDVILTDNIFGDILSDCAAMAAGSLGMLPSASLGPVNADGRRRALYEPVHGSAPDIAGKGIANPLGAILSVAMMLRLSFDRADDARLIERAVGATLAKGDRTADIREPGEPAISTQEMGNAVLRELERLAST